jgi:hypothetical protein
VRAVITNGKYVAYYRVSTERKGKAAWASRRNASPSPAHHLTARGRPFRDSMAANDPSHDRVEVEPLSTVHVVVPAKPPENRLTDLREKTVATVLPTTGVRQYGAGNLGQSDRIIQFLVRHPSCVTRDLLLVS